jgi:hypothetical protein
VRSVRGLILVLAVAALMAAAPSEAAQEDAHNAATWYQKAYGYLDGLSDADREAIDAYEPGLPPSPALKLALSKVSTALAYARRGSRLRYADFGLAYDQGFALTLPHLHHSRVLARAIRADAMVRLHEGDADGAADRIATIYRMGEHAGGDRVIISSLVGQVMWELGERAMSAMIDRAALGPAEAAAVLRAVQDIPERDPFGYVEAVFMEQELGVATLERTLLDAGNPQGLAALMAPGEVPPELARMSRAEAEAAIDAYERAMSATAEIFVTDDPQAAEARRAALEQAVEDGAYGPLTRLLLPALGKVHERMRQSEVKVAARRQMLQALAAGEIDPRSEANAAFWYVRAAILLRDRGPAALEALRAGERDAAAIMAEPLAPVLDGANDVLDVLREASGMKRCDFAPLRPAARGPWLVTPYAEGVRDLLRLIMADAVRRGRLGQAEALADRLRIGWSMLDHLEGDPTYATAITTHAAFNRMVRLTTEAGPVPQELLTIAGRLGRTDPFGYAAAAVQARRDLLTRAEAMADRAAVGAAERWAAAGKLASDFDGETLLGLAALVEESPVPAGLADVFDAAAVELLEREREPMLAHLRELRFEEVLAWEAPAAPAAIEERQRQARTDLRRGLMQLQPPAEAGAGRGAEKSGPPA